MVEKVRLTQLAHGGGCGCKIAPALLQEIVSASPAAHLFPQLLVGLENGDDAAVYQINDSQAIVASTDFFMPVVDDPFDFGRIAATNALSDIYAMGAQPVFALAIAGLPVDKLAPAQMRDILRGGEAICAEAGIPIAGGHSIDAPEPIYGLVAIGLVHPARLKRNQGAQPGDVLILAKPLGVGSYSAALKRGQLSEQDYASLLQATTCLNKPGTALGELDGVHAMTDVTGFGLAGHGWEMARGSELSLTFELSRLPLMSGLMEKLRAGFITGASARNWAGYGEHIQLPATDQDLWRALVTDPQTSGGLLVACDASVQQEVLAIFHRQGFARACCVGRVEAGPARVVFI